MVQHIGDYLVNNDVDKVQTFCVFRKYHLQLNYPKLQCTSRWEESWETYSKTEAMSAAQIGRQIEAQHKRALDKETDRLIER